MYFCPMHHWKRLGFVPYFFPKSCLASHIDCPLYNKRVYCSGVRPSQISDFGSALLQLPSRTHRAEKTSLVNIVQRCSNYFFLPCAWPGPNSEVLLRSEVCIGNQAKDRDCDWKNSVWGGVTQTIGKNWWRPWDMRHHRSSHSWARLVSHAISKIALRFARRVK